MWYVYVRLVHLEFASKCSDFVATLNASFILFLYCVFFSLFKMFISISSCKLLFGRLRLAQPWVQANNVEAVCSWRRVTSLYCCNSYLAWI